MNVNQVTPKQMRWLHKQMANKFGVKIYHDSRKLTARIARWFYNRLMARYLKTVPKEMARLRPCCIGDIIFLPWQSGDESIRNLKQISTLVHELVHSTRIFDAPGGTKRWYSQYFLDDRFRALEETTAIQASADLGYWYTGTYRELSLKSYYCGPTAERIAYSDYDRQRKVTKSKGRGSTFCSVCAQAIKLLQEIGVTPI
jgi:hypothetical protein